MKRKRQSGQVFILTLILLAIGAIVVIPSLQLTQNALRNSPIITSRANDFYAADAAQEYVMWKLLYTSYISSFTYDGQEDNFTVDVCATPVNVSVTMRALATFKGVTLVGNTPIKPTKTVTPNTNPGGAILTYTIRLEQISSNTSQGLDAVYDILPADFAAGDYIPGSSQLSVDGGPWTVIGNPLIESFGGVERLRWPASGSFASPIRDFTGGQVKEIKFQMASSSLKNNKTYYNWVVLKPWNTLSGAIAKIVTGTGATPQGGLVSVNMTVTPNFVPPGVPTVITYTIQITNQQGSTDQIQVVDDFLPPGFEYYGPTTGMTTIDPVEIYGLVNGVYRWKLEWTKLQFPGGNDISIAAGETKTMTFKGITSENVSGSYYNELTVQTKNPVPAEFSTLGLTYQDFNSGYTWNSAPVIVPAYDTSTTSGDVTTDTNLAVTSYGVAISSYQVR
ncbi:MAG: hypothetical protein ABIH70_08085 [Chloroflexota bacterium]